MSALIRAVIGKVCIMKLNTNAGPLDQPQYIRRGGTIPDFELALHGSGRPRLDLSDLSQIRNLNY